MQGGLGVRPDSTTDRRWSQLIFPEPAVLARKPSIVRVSKISPDEEPPAVSETEAIIRRISTVKRTDPRKHRMSIDSEAWVNEGSPFNLEDVVKTKSITDKAIKEGTPAISDTPSVDAQQNIKSIKERISASFRGKKAKYTLLLTTLALVGGYKEELSSEEHHILEHTGTQKFLMSDMCMDVIQNSLTPDLKFISKELEVRYILENNDKHSQKFWNFSVKGIICELIVTLMAIISLYFHRNSTLAMDGVVVKVIVIIFICTGSQFFIAAVTTIPERSKLEPTAVLLLGIWSACTLTGIVTLASSTWCGLQDYQLLVPLILPQFPIVHTFMLEGISFRSKIIISLMLGVFYLLWNFNSYVGFTPLVSIVIYIAIFSPKETTAKSEYLMELIATTQANLVKEESEKSAHVLTTILPKRIIIRLLADPTTMFYEEFSIVTVLHMDIAGFVMIVLKNLV
ncbi:UNVERIFIED_CONTAM: hypothetical protein HDU68_002063 [Siphonaria sp. JEL0065]|nr:hypothetical protein HDU68_002063 [Siphonaria sp. JEL0065]